MLQIVNEVPTRQEQTVFFSNRNSCIYLKLHRTSQKNYKQDYIDVVSNNTFRDQYIVLWTTILILLHSTEMARVKTILVENKR